MTSHDFILLCGGFVLFFAVGMSIYERIVGPDPDLTEADFDTMCRRCGARGGPRHIHPDR